MANKYSKLKFSLFLILLVLMPMHTLIFSRILRSIKILSIWRDLIILYLVLSKTRTGIKMSNLDISILISLICIVFYTIISGDLSSLNTTRLYVMPLLIYFYTRNNPFTKKEFEKILLTCMITATIVSAWGLVQAFIMGPQIMFRLGYANAGGRFTSTSFYINGWNNQRVIGTFSSPNACGAYLAIIILLITNCRASINNKRLYLACLFIIILGLMGTFSRSAWIGCVLGLILFNGSKNKVSYRGIIFLFGGLLLAAIVAIAMSRTSVFQTMFAMVRNHIGNTVTQSDASFAFHIKQLYEPIRLVCTHPFGLGFGTNGSFALSHLPIDKTHQVESSIWVMCYELGILGMMIYYFPFAYIIVYCGKKKKNCFMSSAAKICICSMMTYLVLPSVQNYESPFFVMLFAGIAMCTGKSITYTNKRMLSMKSSKIKAVC